MGAIRLDREHYAAFSAPRAEESRRMMKGQIWPELRRLSEALIPGLSQLVGRDLHPHLAFQGGREGPVREAFTAFSSSRKEFRDHPHFTLAVDRTGVHARVSLGIEARDERERLAKRIERDQTNLVKRFRSMAGLRSYFLLAGGGNVTDIALDEGFWKSLVGALRLPSGGLDIGFGWSSSRARSKAQIEIMTAFERLAPIYRLMDAED
jgi:uncharacterized protein YktB (UPF0637 family)